MSGQDEFCEVPGCRWDRLTLHCVGSMLFPSTSAPPCSAPFPEASSALSIWAHTPQKVYSVPSFLNVLLPSHQNLPVLRCVSSWPSFSLSNLGPRITLPRNKLEIYRSLFKSEWLSPNGWLEEWESRPHSWMGERYLGDIIFSSLQEAMQLGLE